MWKELTPPSPNVLLVPSKQRMSRRVEAERGRDSQPRVYEPGSNGGGGETSGGECDVFELPIGACAVDAQSEAERAAAPCGLIPGNYRAVPRS